MYQNGRADTRLTVQSPTYIVPMRPGGVLVAFVDYPVRKSPTYAVPMRPSGIVERLRAIVAYGLNGMLYRADTALTPR
jgi:hypothetical protein